MPRKTPVKWSNYDLAEEARKAEVFNSDLIQTFLDVTENNLYESWKQETDSEEREKLWLQCQGICAFRKFIEDTIALGKMAQAEINKKMERESNPKGLSKEDK